MTAAARVHLGATAAFVAFAIWVSLAPFDHRPATFDDAVYMLSVAGGPGTIRVSLADAVSNLLLFIPIGLFGSAAIGRTTIRRAAVVLTGGLLLSIAIEFCQAFVIWRTPSQVDVIAECMGAALGLMLARVFHAEIDTAVTTAILGWRRAAVGQRAALIYAAAFALAWLFPFDLTIQPSEVGDKYLHKRLLPPFAPSPDAAGAFELALVGVAVIPLSWAAARYGRTAHTRRGATQTVFVTMLGVIALTIAQAGVFSRNTDFTVVIAALPGVMFGAVAAGWKSRARFEPAGERT